MRRHREEEFCIVIGRRLWQYAYIKDVKGGGRSCISAHIGPQLDVFFKQNPKSWAVRTKTERSSQPFFGVPQFVQRNITSQLKSKHCYLSTRCFKSFQHRLRLSLFLVAITGQILLQEVVRKL